MIGTTHFINAIVEGSGLARRRRCGSDCRPPRHCRRSSTGRSGCVRRSAGTRTSVTAATSSTAGSSRRSTRTSCAAWPTDIAAKGVRSVAISSVFSPVNGEFERQAAEILRPRCRTCWSASRTRSGGSACWSGRTRRSSTPRCASSPSRSSTGSRSRSSAQGIDAPLYLSQNDGTLMDVEYARRYPVATFASGPTNSMRGAAFLSGLDDVRGGRHRRHHDRRRRAAQRFPARGHRPR